jgi:hypothetical protein
MEVFKMKTRQICKEEIEFFYLWLCGAVGKQKPAKKNQ